MKTEWDYSTLADAYIDRPPYSGMALAKLFAIAGLTPKSVVCDIGAGVGHLTIPLAELGCTVVAVEPNDAMRANGMKRTTQFPNVTWVEAGGEDTGQPSASFNFVSFGSSFNVLNRQAALVETHRILAEGGHFTCMWNHRDLRDPIQSKIEGIIQSEIKDYEYGVRREDQTEVIRDSGLFENILQVTGDLLYPQNVERVIEAWRSHATLHRQAGDKFTVIIGKIEKYLRSLSRENIDIPYVTTAWIAKRKD